MKWLEKSKVLTLELERINAPSVIRNLPLEAKDAVVLLDMLSLKLAHSCVESSHVRMHRLC